MWEPQHRGGPRAGAGACDPPQLLCLLSHLSFSFCGTLKRNIAGRPVPAGPSQPSSTALWPCSRGDGETFGLLSACRAQSDWMAQNLKGENSAFSPVSADTHPSSHYGRHLLSAQAGPNEAQESTRRLFIDPLAIQHPLKLDFACEWFVGSFSACRLSASHPGRRHRDNAMARNHQRPASPSHSHLHKTFVVTESLENGTGESGQTDRLVQHFCKAICYTPGQLTVHMPMT